MDLDLHEENEKKKEYLMQYQRALRREQDILEEIQRLRADKLFPSIVTDGLPGTRNHADLSDYIAILDAQIEQLKRERLEKAKAYTRIREQIAVMSDETEKEVLWLRYIKSVTWEEIAKRTGYSYRQVLRIHGKALKKFKMS